MTATLEATIETLGHRGDGIAEIDGRRIYVPYTLPGDRVRIAVKGERGRLLDLLEAGPERSEPVCPHFGQCGGCALQHVAMPAYAGFKREQVEAALRQRGLAAVPVAGPIVVPPGTRRRATFSVLRTRENLILGFNAAQSHRIVAVGSCPVLVPSLEQILAPLRDLLRDLFRPGEQGRVLLTATDTGADIAIEGRADLDHSARERLADFAHTQGAARVSWDGETVLERSAPVVRFDDIPVRIPPGAFLQASAGGEKALQQLVLGGIGPAARVIDLYAGCGTFTLPLARRAAVHAVEGDDIVLRALAAAARQAPGLKPITVERRNLAKRPLDTVEFDGVGAVVFDPPRTGARAQAEVLARSAVPRVIGVSCNPATFARDARLLVDGGYALMSITPVDQFLWSPHIELVGVFIQQ